MHEHHNHHVAHQSNHEHHHEHMIADFKKRFYVSLVLALPIILLSDMIQSFLTTHWLLQVITG